MANRVLLFAFIASTAQAQLSLAPNTFKEQPMEYIGESFEILQAKDIIRRMIQDPANTNARACLDAKVAGRDKMPFGYVLGMATTMAKSICRPDVSKGATFKNVKDKDFRSLLSGGNAMSAND